MTSPTPFPSRPGPRGIPSDSKENFESVGENTMKINWNNKDFDLDFEGGGKMPSRPKIETKKSQGNCKNNTISDFGNRGASWEMDWKNSPEQQISNFPLSSLFCCMFTAPGRPPSRLEPL